MTLTFGSLFSGIGGLDLGLERAGMVCQWQVENNDYASRVLAKHWPHVRRWDDVRTWPQPDTERVDLLCGGFPCQDISHAGKRAGITGAKSGLWFEYSRIIRELRPRIVLVENVAALLGRGLDRVLGELAEVGYDAEWACVPALSVGALHIRDRVFVVAYSVGNGHRTESGTTAETFERGDHPKQTDRRGAMQPDGEGAISPAGNCSDADMSRLGIGQVFGGNAREELAAFERSNRTGPGVWSVEPDVVRVANGVPKRVDRLRGLGNAVVPQVGEFIGRRIVEALCQLKCQKY